MCPSPAKRRGGRVEADPAGAGDEDLGPGVQVGEVLGGPGGPVEADHAVGVGGQLHEVAGDEAGGQAVLPQQAHQQPGAVAAGADAEPQRLVGRLDAGLHPHRVGDVAVDGGVEAGEERHDRDAVVGQRRQRRAPGAGGVALLDRPEVRRQVGRQRRLVVEGEALGVLLHEEVERVDHHQVGDQTDGDVELADLLGEDDPGQPVAERVLLPVEEVALRADRQRVGLDRRARVRRRPQPDDVRRDVDRVGEGVGGPMLERDLDRHGAQPARHALREGNRPGG